MELSISARSVFECFVLDGEAVNPVEGHIDCDFMDHVFMSSGNWGRDREHDICIR